MPSPNLLQIQAGQLDIVALLNVDFDTTFTFEDADGNPVDLTGQAADLMIRQQVDSSVVLFEFSTANSRIILGNGTVRLHALKADTALVLPVIGGYDLIITFTDGRQIPLLAGQWTWKKTFTR